MITDVYALQCVVIGLGIVCVGLLVLLLDSRCLWDRECRARARNLDRMMANQLALQSELTRWQSLYAGVLNELQAAGDRIAQPGTVEQWERAEAHTPIIQQEADDAECGA